MRAQIRRRPSGAIREAAGAAPARTVRSRAPGRLRDPPWGYYGPCARCSLTARLTSGHASAARSWGKCPKGICLSRWWSAARRACRSQGTPRASQARTVGAPCGAPLPPSPAARVRIRKQGAARAPLQAGDETWRGATPNRNPNAALFSSTFAAYIGGAVPQGPAMAINGRRNKPFGPGGSTRRLHHQLIGSKAQREPWT